MSDPRLAVLIDADNVSGKHAADIFEELAGYGTLTVKRAYGDWTTDQLGGWKKRLPEHAISPMQQFAWTTGKNSTDSALIIDAMDLLYGGNLDGFAIVSSDSDFTKLATRLRESGMTVYGLGAKKTPKPFRDACDQFVFLENLGDTAEPLPEPVAEVVPEVVAEKATTTKKTAASRSADTEAAPADGGSGRNADGVLQSVLTKALNKVDTDDDDWATLSTVGDHLRRTDPSFDPRTHGFGKLSDMVKAQRFIETRTVTGESGRGQLWVRLKGRRQRSVDRTVDRTP